MCIFFSFISDKKKFYYFDWETRKGLLVSNPQNYSTDSHSSIAAFFNIDEDSVNKYEYNPLLQKFQVDMINIKDNSEVAENWVRKLDFKTICKPLILKPIVNPLEIIPKLKNGKPSKNIILLLQKWNSVWKSVLDSLRNSVGISVLESVGNSVWESVWDSLRKSVLDSLRNSVGISVLESVGISVLSYLSSFFNIQYKYDFSSCIELWESGFVPSYDGKMWNLHCRRDAKIIYINM